MNRVNRRSFGVYDVIVIGGGLAGLGVADGLDKSTKILVLEKTEPRYDGKDRFRPEISASFKNAGMLDMGSNTNSMKEYFARQTIDLYRKKGINVIDNGGYTMASTHLTSLATDVMLKRVSFSQFKELEPHVRLSRKLDGIYKFIRGSKAEPEAAMKTITTNLSENIEIKYGEEVSHIRFMDGTWFIDTELKTFEAKKLVIAAGPGSKKLLKMVGNYKLDTVNVLGVMTSSETLPISWLKGSILGARSLFYWTVRETLTKILRCGKETLEITSWFGESKNWTTHLYINTHDDKIYVGGPRVVIPDDYTFVHLEPTQYQSEMDSTLSYAKTLIKFPDFCNFRYIWSGVMCFTKDNDNPLVGPVNEEKNLYLSTGFASAGYREAFGAGHFLANIIENGLSKLTINSNKYTKDWKSVMPYLRVKQE